MAFSWFFKPKDKKTLGVNLGNGDGIKAEIDKMQGSIVKASRGYQNNIKKYKDVAQFNQHLTKSYVANMKVIVDVSELLNSYTSVFNSLKDEFSKMEEVMGRQLDKADFDYLETLTKSKVEELQTEFNKQASGIKKLYAQYGKPEELNRILLAQSDMQKALEHAESTYKNLTVEKTKEVTGNSNSNIGHKKVLGNATVSNTNVSNASNATKNKKLLGNVSSTPLNSAETFAINEQALINATLQSGGKKKTARKSTVGRKTKSSKK
jgi:CRISPR/Cas system-associated endonuclease Cas3-HD